jgi:broad specificity phosphatase PhoE
MSQFPPLLVMRHGETEWNVLGKFQGHENSPLTEVGRAQAAHQFKLLDRLEGSEGLQAYVSPQGRTVETAKIALDGREFSQDARLMEIAFGDWEGMPRTEIKQIIGESFDTFQWYFESPGGEDYDAIYTRVLSFLLEIKEPAIIVTHGVTMMILRGICMGLDRERLLKLDRTQGVIYDVREGRETIVR